MPNVRVNGLSEIFRSCDSLIVFIVDKLKEIDIFGIDLILVFNFGCVFLR